MRPARFRTVAGLRLPPGVAPTDTGKRGAVVIAEWSILMAPVASIVMECLNGGAKPIGNPASGTPTQLMRANGLANASVPVVSLTVPPTVGSTFVLRPAIRGG